MFSIIKTSHNIMLSYKVMLSHKVMLSCRALRRSAQVLSLRISWVAAARRNLGTIIPTPTVPNLSHHPYSAKF